MPIRGTEGLSPADLQAELARGARFVAYQWCASIVVMTFKRSSGIYYLRPGQTGFGPNFRWSLLSLVAGWWGFPWGPIYTLSALVTNLRGGLDVTAAIAADLANKHGAPPAPPLDGAFTGAQSRWSPAPLAALGLLALGGLAVFAGRQHYARTHMPVALVNGLGTTYPVEINGTRHTLRPHQVTRTEMPEGQFIVVATLPGGTGESRFSFDTAAVPSGDKVTVINPDAAALVAEETTIYTPESAPKATAPAPVLHSGQTAYILSEPDFFLSAFPDSIQMSESAGQTRRTRVEILADLTPEQAADIVLRYSNRAAMLAYLYKVGALLPQNQAVLMCARQTLEPGEAKAFFAQHLATRPVLVEWHRSYQHYMNTRQPELDLQPEYRRLAESEPEEGALAYLYGRLLNDPPQGAVWYQRALAARRPCAYGHHGLAANAAGRGDFSGARAALDRARQDGLDTAAQRTQRLDCLLALHRFDEALREFTAQPREGPADFGYAATQVHLSYLAGGKAAAEKSIKGFLAGLPASVRKHSGDGFRKELVALLAYFEGDTAAYAVSFPADADANDQLTAALCRNDRAAAEKALTAGPGQAGTSWLLLYLAAYQAGDAGAENFWARAGAAFTRESSDKRRIGAHLNGTAAMPLANLLDLSTRLEEKRILLAALGAHDPVNRAAFFARAAQCNVSRQFPHHLIAAVLGNAVPVATPP